MTSVAEQSKAEKKGGQDWRTIGLVALIVALGLALRLWGIGWSLPNAQHPLATYHPDELVNLNAALAADIPHGKFDIGFYNYGTFYFYLVSFAHTFARGYGLIPTPSANADPLGAQAVAQQAALFLTGRIVTLLLGTATIPVVFALGNRLFGRKTGLLAALLFALAPLAVVHSHFLTVDVPATFFVALALLWAARLLTIQTWRDYALAGIWSGVAAATKYNTGLVLIAPVAAHFLNKIPNTCRKHRGAQFVVLLCVAALAFLIACPGPALNLDAFWDGLPNYPGSGVRYELFEHSRTGHGDLFVNTGPGWWYHLVVSLRYGLGTPLLLLALAGLVLSGMRRTKQDWLLLSFFLLYYLATGASAVRFARYMIPLFPVFCVLAARFVTEPFPQPHWTRLRMAAGVVVAALAGFSSLVYCRTMSLPDPRDVAAQRLEREAPQGASIAFAKIPWFFSPPLSPYFGALAAPARARAATETTRFQLRIPTSEWDTSVLTPPPDCVIVSNLETMHAYYRLHQPAAVKFMEAIPSSYHHWTTAPASPAPAADGQTLFPEDLLYILPVITVYQK